MTDVRLVSRLTGSVVVVPEEKADGLRILGFAPEGDAKKAPAKKAAAKRSSSKS